MAPAVATEQLLGAPAALPITAVLPLVAPAVATKQLLGSIGSAAFGSACPFNERLVLSAVENKPWCAAPRATILQAAWFHAFLEEAGSQLGGSA